MKRKGGYDAPIEVASSAAVSGTVLDRLLLVRKGALIVRVEPTSASIQQIQAEYEL